MTSIKLLLLILLSFTLQAQNDCQKHTNVKLNSTYYICSDGSVSFAQPPSTKFDINWTSLYSELKIVLRGAELEDFPYQLRKDYSEKTSSSEDSPSKSGSDSNSNSGSLDNSSKKSNSTKLSYKERISDGYKSIKRSIKQYKANLSIAEGYCGATAASNVFYALCDELITLPSQLMNKYFKDSGPGIFPGTLVKGLNKLFSNHQDDCMDGSWHYYYSKNKYDFLDSIYKHTKAFQPSWAHNRAPLIVFTGEADGDSLHYITIVNIEGYIPYHAENDHLSDNCKVTYNDDSSRNQTTISCKEILKQSENVVKNSLLKTVLKKYTRIVFVPKR